MAAGNRKKTSGVHFCQKRGLFSLLNFRKFRQMFLLILTLFRMLKIAGRVILKTRNSSATTILLMSRTMKIRKLKLFYCQKNARYRAKELWRDIFLGNLSLKEGKNSVGLPVLILEFWWRHVQTKMFISVVVNQGPSVTKRIIYTDLQRTQDEMIVLLIFK